MNIAKVPPPFVQACNYIYNEFYLQLNLLFARNLHWTKSITLNPGKRRWATACTWMNSGRWPFLGFDSWVNERRLKCKKCVNVISIPSSLDVASMTNHRTGACISTTKLYLQFVCSDVSYCKTTRYLQNFCRSIMYQCFLRSVYRHQSWDVPSNYEESIS